MHRQFYVRTSFALILTSCLSASCTSRQDSAEDAQANARVAQAQVANSGVVDKVARHFEQELSQLVSPQGTGHANLRVPSGMSGTVRFRSERILSQGRRAVADVISASHGLVRSEKVFDSPERGGQLLGTRAFSAERLLVQLKSAAGVSAARKRLETLGYVPKDATAYGLLRVTIPVSDADSVIAARAAIEQETALVLRVDLDEQVPVTAVPNDPYFCAEWHHHNGGSFLQRLELQANGNWVCAPGENTDGTSEMHSVEGWDIRHDAPNIVVAFIDTGFDYTHPDLAANAWVNTQEIAGNGIDDDANGYVDDIHGIDAVLSTGNPQENGSYHGTMVAGTIGAVGNNGVGVSGVAWKVQLMGLRAEPEGQWGSLTLDGILRGFDYAIAHQAKVINCSFGGTFALPSVADAIERARVAGITVVTGAGNDGIDIDVTPFYPAAYAATHDNLVVVGAVDNNTSTQWLHNWGAHTVHLAAPTDAILTTVTSDLDLLSYPLGYGPFGGTSSTAPLVSGTVALLTAEYPTWSYLAVKAKILQNVDIVVGFDSKCITGGRLNLYKALKPATATCTDILKNGSETDVDCGGSCTQKCAVGAACGIHADCQSMNCQSGQCAATAEPCSPAITLSGWSTGNFYTTGPVCYKITDNILGWGCANCGGRTIEVNRVVVTDQQMPLPAPINGGYYFKISAGAYPWASLYWWH